ncbi:Multifunctional methyltransferase subunit-like protein [Capsicum annuum]|nr:Multifunctional methyltransferase subunit-like protein [Capsicum annuum]
MGQRRTWDNEELEVFVTGEHYLPRRLTVESRKETRPAICRRSLKSSGIEGRNFAELLIGRELRKTMRLLTHNMLSSNIKGVANGFPLKIEVVTVVEKEVEFNIEFLKKMFSKVEWKALAEASRTMGYTELPENADASMLDSDDFLHKFHHALLELHLEEGALVCPETGRKFPVNKGVPNMLLHEDEV